MMISVRNMFLVMMMAVSVSAWAQAASPPAPSKANADVKVEASPATAKKIEEFVPSFGTSHESLMFGPTDAQLYFDAIRHVERAYLIEGVMPDSVPAKTAPVKTLTMKKSEKINYPHFYMPTILYHAPARWWVQINGMMITPKSNKQQNEIYLTDVQPNRVSVRWRVKDQKLFSALHILQQHNAPSKHQKMIAHRAVKTGVAPRMLDGEDVIHFMVQPNQVFYSKYMTVYEGHPRGIILPAVDHAPVGKAPPVKPMVANAPATPAPASDPLAGYNKIRASLRKKHDERQANKEERTSNEAIPPHNPDQEERAAPDQPTSPSQEAIPLHNSDEDKPVVSESQEAMPLHNPDEEEPVVSEQPASEPPETTKKQIVDQIEQQIESVLPSESSEDAAELESLEELPESPEDAASKEAETEEELLELESLDGFESLDDQPKKAEQTSTTK
ncbi:MAG: hypothetical protein EAY65_04610 [Alphaproteobacteria bacterium]|nr:MAG: hypothetical protein EAY65_04610 [Alphaproteobacteria bacterium]